MADDTPGIRLYSGSRSVAFWKRVNACDNREIYTMGCILQDVEQRVLASLEEDERTRKPRKPRKKR